MSTLVIATDMDGTLTTVDTWRGVHAWTLAHHPSAAARRFVVVRLPLVVASKAGLIDREAFRARWLRDQARLLRGVEAGRLAELGDWVVEHHLWPARRVPAVAAVLAAAREARAVDPAARIVLATGAFQPVADAFARRLGADVALGTPLEVRDGVATGALAVPTQSGDLKAAAIRAYAGDGDVVAAFGDTAADIPMLTLARRAVAVAPDGSLRRAAAVHGWEILDA